MQDQEEREELSLYLFKTHARNKMLAFKKILSSEFPLRMLPLDQLESFMDDDFDVIERTPTKIASTGGGLKKSKTTLIKSKSQKGEI